MLAVSSNLPPERTYRLDGDDVAEAEEAGWTGPMGSRLQLSDWLTLAAIPIGAILGGFITWFFARRERRTTGLTYELSEVPVISPSTDADDRLRITWEGEVVPRVTKTALAIWSSGTETIHGADITALDPLRLEVPDGVSVLRASITRQTRPVTDVAIADVTEGRIDIAFDFLDAKDGLVVEVLHTGGYRSLMLAGTLKGMPAGPARYDGSKLAKGLLIGLVATMAPVVIIALLAVVLMAAAFPLFFFYKAWIESWPANLVSGSIGLLILALYVICFWKRAPVAEPGPHRMAGVPDALASELGGVGSDWLTKQQAADGNRQPR